MPHFGSHKMARRVFFGTLFGRLGTLRDAFAILRMIFGAFDALGKVAQTIV